MMGVVIATGFTGTTYPLTHGRVCYQWWSDGTASATSADSGFPSTGALPVRTDTAWRPTALPATWTLDYPSTRNVSFIGIAKHDLGSLNATVALEYLQPRYNLLDYTQEFDNSLWSENNTTVTANSEVAPDGTTTAEELSGASSAANLKFLTQDYTTTETGTYTFAVWLKQGTDSDALIRLCDNTNFNDVKAQVNLANGTIALRSGDGSPTDRVATIKNAGNGWYRVSVSANFTAALTLLRPQIWIEGYQNSTRTTGFYVWGAQLEFGSTATAYQHVTDTPQFMPQATITPIDDSPILLLTEEKDVDSVRMTVSSADANPTISIIMAGVADEWPRPFVWTGQPVTEGDRIKFENTVALTGNWLGRSVVSDGLQFEVTMNNASETWRQTKFKDFKEYANGNDAAFFIALRPSDYPNELAYAWATDVVRTERTQANKRISTAVTMTLQGLRPMVSG